MTVAREKQDYELAVVQDQSPTLTHCPVYNLINKNLNMIFALGIRSGKLVPPGGAVRQVEN